MAEKDRVKIDEEAEVFLEYNFTLLCPEVNQPALVHDQINEMYADSPEFLEYYNYADSEALSDPNVEAELRYYEDAICKDLNKLLKEEAKDRSISFTGETDVREYPHLMQQIREYVDATYATEIRNRRSMSIYYDISNTIYGFDSTENAKKQHSMISNFDKKCNEKIIAETIKTIADSGNKQNLVRGALLRCTCGSHYRMLNLRHDHGVYVKGEDKPQAHANDAKAGIRGHEANNIGWFGHCLSTTPPTGAEWIRLEPYTPMDQAGQYRMSQAERTDMGWVCVPKFAMDEWQITEEKAFIDGEIRQVASMQSYIICDHGGLVYPITSGQMEFNFYEPPYANCPYASDVRPNSAFMRYCDDKGICPYFPGTPDYDKWYADAIDANNTEIEGLEKEWTVPTSVRGSTYLTGNDDSLIYVQNHNRLQKRQEDNDRLLKEHTEGLIRSGMDEGHTDDRVLVAYYGDPPPRTPKEEVAMVKAGYAREGARETCSHSPGTARSNAWYISKLSDTHVEELKEQRKSQLEACLDSLTGDSYRTEGSFFNELGKLDKSIQAAEKERRLLYDEFMTGLIRSGAYDSEAAYAVRYAFHGGAPQISFEQEVADYKLAHSSEYEVKINNE